MDKDVQEAVTTCRQVVSKFSRWLKHYPDETIGRLLLFLLLLPLPLTFGVVYFGAALLTRQQQQRSPVLLSSVAW